jgi:hypothetical protein
MPQIVEVEASQPIHHEALVATRTKELSRERAATPAAAATAHA